MQSLSPCVLNERRGFGCRDSRRLVDVVKLRQRDCRKCHQCAGNAARRRNVSVGRHCGVSILSSRRLGNRSASARNVTSASMRASCAPRQWWMPPPNDSGRTFSARDVERFGILVLRGVAIGRAEQTDDAVAAFDRDAFSSPISQSSRGLARRQLHGGIVAQQFVDRACGERRDRAPASPIGRGCDAAPACRCR